jgi:RNA polymerase sigma-70 factor (ECF subfamily)
VQTLVWDKDDAKDLISETTLIAFEKFDQIKSHHQFLFYLFGIAHRLFLKSLRRNKFKGTWNKEQLENKIGGQETDSNLLKLELQFWLSKLSPIEQEVLTLFEISGFSYVEISQILDIQETKVKSTLYQARQQLKLLIQAEKGAKNES